MLNKIRNALAAMGLVMLAMAAAYFKGLKKGKENERLENAARIQKNIRAVRVARARLDDDDCRRRLHDKYRRR